jgi:hypothetical protein
MQILIFWVHPKPGMNKYIFVYTYLLSKKEYMRFKILMEMSVQPIHVLLIIFCGCDFLLCVFFSLI